LAVGRRAIRTIPQRRYVLDVPALEEMIEHLAELRRVAFADYDERRREQAHR
jgi:hypothetical protein